MSSGVAFVHRYLRHLRWLILLALLPMVTLLLVVITAYALGLRVQSAGWQGGLALNQWQWWQGDCVKASGTQLRVSAWRPVTITMTSLSLPTCDTGTEALTSPPWTPAFDLAIDKLSVPGVPPLQVTIHQRQQRWQVQAHHQGSKATANYDRLSGAWVAQGHIRASDMMPTLLGELAFTAKGVWRGEKLDGALQAKVRQLGYQGQPQRADAVLTARLTARQWQLVAALDAPVALRGGWSLVARKAVQAGGNMDGLESLNLDLRAAGPQGSVQLTLATEGSGVARGQGVLALSGPTLSGTVPLRWDQQQLELAPTDLQLPEGLRLRWSHPITLPLALTGASKIAAEFQYQDLTLKTVDSLLSWQQAQWNWQGRLDLAGNMSGYQVSGQWQGQIDADGPSGAAANLQLRGPEVALDIKLPVAGVQAPQWATRAEVTGRYGDWPLQGVVIASYLQDQWKGTLQGSSRLPFYDQGGQLTVSAPWYGKDGQWILGAGSRATVAEGLIGGLMTEGLKESLRETTLIKPIAITATSPLRLTDKGLFGTLQLNADGVVAPSWTLPTVTGRMTVSGQQGQARLQLPAWQSDLSVSAVLADSGKSTREKGPALHGTVQLTTPLSAPMSRGLGVTLQKGQLSGQGTWQWQDHWQVQGNMKVSGLALDWGGILASGGNGAAQVRLHKEGLTLTSTGAVTLAELALGTPVRNVSMTVRSDLSTWHFAGVYAELLGGTLRAPALQWPSPHYQPVAISHIDLAELAALQNDPNPTVQLTGRVAGVLPLQLEKNVLALKDGQLANEGPLSLKVLPSAGVKAMGQSNLAVQLALDTLSQLTIHDFQAHMNMTPDGWLDARVTIKGMNPQQRSRLVVLNYTHRENVLELLRSLRISDELSKRVINRIPAGGSQ